MIKKILRVFGVLVGVLLLLAVSAVFWANGAASRALAKKYPVPDIQPIVIPGDSASIARGSHLALAVSNCVECHGPDLGGSIFMDAGPLGVVTGPNLTRGVGGIGSRFTDADWIRAIRYGVRADSTSLIIMPSESFAHMSDSDLGALIAYLRQLPPVDREIPRTHFRTLGKVLLATGAFPVLVAEHTPAVQRREVIPSVSVEYGGYLAEISGCKGCHGMDLSGGEAGGPPGAPLPPNLTTGGPTGSWSEGDFFRLFREGKRPDGTSITDFMPWRVMRGMTDEELRALYMYVRSVPPVVGT